MAVCDFWAERRRMRARLRQRQRDAHHIGEGCLPLKGGGVLLGVQQAVADGADAQRLFAGAGGGAVEGGGFHLHAQHAHACPFRARLRIVVEDVAGENVAHVVAQALSLAQVGGTAHQLVGGDGGIGAGQAVLMGEVAVGAGALGYDEVAHAHTLGQRAARAHANDGLHVVEVVDLGEHLFPKYIEAKEKEWKEYHTTVSEYELNKYLGR